MTATLRDIAKLAGVNAGSVSRVLQNHPRARAFRPETRQRILEAAQKLHYRRNELAAAIRTGRNRTVAVITRLDESHKSVAAADSAVIAGILDEATRLDHNVKLFADHGLPAAFDSLVSRRIDRVLSQSVDPDKRARTARFCRKHGLKLVFLFERPVGAFPAVTTADRASMRDAVLHLARAGHRRVALACGPHRFHYVRERHAGYRAGLKQAGLEYRPGYAVCSDDPKRQQALDALLGRPAGDRPTAFVCIADALAFRIQNAALRRRLRVPQDVSVIGFGDCSLSHLSYAPLCTVAQPFGAMGAAALRLLLDQPGPDLEQLPDGSRLLPNTLVLRESVAPAPDAAELNSLLAKPAAALNAT